LDLARAAPAQPPPRVQRQQAQDEVAARLAGATAPSSTFWKMASGVLAAKGGRPTTISYRMTPKLHQSTSAPCPVPSSSSGAR
ncbi:hypothetical protein APUTEX25_001714, partial [Auxenochlorella protothecoides]